MTISDCVNEMMKGGNKVKRKFANRPDWRRVLDKSFFLTYVDNAYFNGYVSVMKLHKVKNPLIINMFGRDYRLADDGYTWLQLQPVGKNHCITVMYNENNEIVQWYFDITRYNGIGQDGIPFFDDLYLDVVVLSTGEVLLLDEDELKDALIRGEITGKEYEMAYAEAKSLMSLAETSKEELEALSNKYLKYMLLLNNQEI